MPDMIERDVSYGADAEKKIAYFCAPADAAAQKRPGILVIHGAHGLDDHIIQSTRKIAALGYSVLAGDLWGGRKHPKGPEEFGPILGRFGQDRAFWFASLAEARDILCAQPEVDASRIGAAGYCFGGASVLEFVRMGGAIKAGVSFHGGLDMVADDWTQAIAGTEILIATGAEDPLAKLEDLARVETGMSAAGVVWEANIYSGARHAFTEPDTPHTPPFAGYDARADRRSFDAMCSFFRALL